MKKIVLLIMLLAAGSTWLAAKGDGERGHEEGGHRGRYGELFEPPEQGQLLTNLTGEIILVEGPQREIPVLKTADKSYMLLFRGPMLEEGSKLTVDAYVLEPKEGAELEGFEYEGKKILPALRITMASDEDGNPILRGPRKGRGGHNKRT